VIEMRGKRPSLAAVAFAGMVLAQLAGCGGCVKDDPAQQSSPAASGGRKPIDLRAADQKLSQFSTTEGGADASHD
jgi:type IV pilus biogenesis protein CpaD/CtpE